MKKKVITILIGCAISAGLLIYLFSDVDARLFWAEVKKVNLFYLPVLVICTFFGIYLRAIRWRYLLPRANRPDIREAYDITTLGLLGISILPLRLGEFVRPVLLQRSGRGTFSIAIASVITERVFDVLTLLLFLGLCLLHIPTPPPSIILGAKSLGLLAGIAAMIMGLSYFQPKRASRVGTYLINLTLARVAPGIASRISEMWDEFLTGLSAITGFKEFLLVLFWSIVLWVDFALLYLIGLWAFGLPGDIWVGMTIMVFIALAIAAPSAPGFFGVFQAGTVLALEGIYHYSRELSLGYSIVMHVIQLASLAVFGILVIRKAQFSFRDIFRFTQKPIVVP